MRGATDSIRTAATSDRTIWLPVVGLVALWIAAITDQVWVFAALFIGWALLDIAAGESHFIRRVARREHPLLFWSIVASWIAMSVLWLAAG